MTINARNEFIRNKGLPIKVSIEIRNRAHMTTEEEVAFLFPFIESAKQGGVLVVSVIHKALEKRLGRKVALATAYNLLHRHGWRKLVWGADQFETWVPISASGAELSGVRVWGEN